MDSLGYTVKGLTLTSAWSTVDDLESTRIAREDVMRLHRRAGSCEDGPCPNIFDVEEAGAVEARVGVQGERLIDPEALAQLDGMPAQESVVLVPRRLVEEYAREIGWSPPA